jgi:hypothetical protein
MALEIHVLALDTHKNVLGLNQLMGSVCPPPFPIPLLTVGCPITINTDLKKYKKKNLHGFDSTE